jgi:hypothetical protein
MYMPGLANLQGGVAIVLGGNDILFHVNVSLDL